MLISPSPHLHTTRTVRGIMLRVCCALLPAWAVGLWFFGMSVVWLTLVCVAVCVALEWAVTKFMLHRPSTINDLSAVLTGLLLAMNLPPTLPLWMAVIGAVFAMGIGKMCFGGIGRNIFNPALVGRVFLLISFPAAMTQWVLPDGATGATVLGLIKEGYLTPENASVLQIFLGEIGGSAGEISSAALILGGLYLVCDSVIKWQIPVAIILGVVALDLCVGFPPMVDIFSGGLLLGAIFMATDYSTSPMTKKGMWIYGLAIGVITVCIRRWGAYPEGVSFAILLMNGFTPLINNYFRPKRFSLKPKRKEAAA